MTGKGPRLGATGLFLAVAGPLMLFAVLAMNVTGGAPPEPDRRLLLSLYRNTHGTPLGRAAEFVADPGRWLGLAVILGLFAWLVVRHRLAHALLLAVATGGALALESPLKGLFERPAANRGVDGYSFPSGSAMVSLAAVAAVVLLVGPARHRWLAVAGGATLVLAYGFAIVSLGWHYPSDVLAAWCIALPLVIVLWLALGRPTLWGPSDYSPVARLSRTR
jgi:membrane-associated phospholipid phosphatase